MGDMDVKMLARVGDRVSSVVTVPLRVLPGAARPMFAFDPGRGQFSSTKILKHILANPSESALKTLGVTDVDLFIPILTFVFGEAQLGGQAAVVSTARLKQEFYGLPPNDALMEMRLVKECVHEIGHTFGLTHCRDNTCVMYLSNAIREVDAKSEALCGVCRDELDGRVEALRE